MFGNFASPRRPAVVPRRFERYCFTRGLCIIKWLDKLGEITHPRAPLENTMAAMHAIGDLYVASTAVVTGDVVLGRGANLWFGVVVRGDLARITLGAGVNLQDGVIVHTDTDAPQDVEDGVVV